MRQKTFLLGLGGQKCGSSWLHSYLNEHPNADMGFAKEYHLFDALHLPNCAIFRENAEAKVKESDPSTVTGTNARMRIAFYEDTTRYFDYFADLASANSECLVVGDITPSYCGLPARVLQSIAHEMAERGLGTKLVFIMRDPLERIWSQARMRMKFNPGEFGSQNEALLAVYDHVNFVMRTRYDWTMKQVSGVVPARHVFYGLYEDLFEEATLQKLSNFLGLPYRLSDLLSSRINASNAVKEALPETTKRKIVAFYSETYDYVESVLGSQVRSRWKSFEYLP